MNIIKKTLLVALPVAVLTLVAGGTAEAYYAQSRPLHDPYMRLPYVRGFSQPEVAVPRSYSPYSYGYDNGYQQYDAVTPLIQGQLNFVSNFTYIPRPFPQYFFQYYRPYNYYGW